MDINKINIVMVRKDLRDIPQWELPEGFSFRFYRDGDMERWFDIERASDDANKFTEELFVSTFNNRIDLLPQRMIFICDKAGKEIATSAAWYETQDVGLVHWVAVIPAYQGCGLAKPLLSRTLGLFSGFGCLSAMLRTQAFRIPAISLYIKFGFVPLICDEQHAAVWRAVRDKFGDAEAAGQIIDNALR